MAEPGGYGDSPYGGGPWGGAGSGGGTPIEENLPRTPTWDVFDLTGVVQPNDMDRVEVFVEVSTEGSGGGFFISSFNIASGDTYLDTNQKLIFDILVGQIFTVEYLVTLTALPDDFGGATDVTPDFTDIIADHIGFLATDRTGPVATLFFSKAGILYTGSVHHVLGDMVMGTPNDIIAIPGSSSYVVEGEQVRIRLVADWTTGIVYLFYTPEADIADTGHILRAILPVIPYTQVVGYLDDQVFITVRGTATSESSVKFETYTMSNRALIPNFAPVANPGIDQAVNLCSIIQLNGLSSFDPEGDPITYEWRLIDAPQGSQFVIDGADGYTLTGVAGLTNRFYSTELGVVDATDPIDVGNYGDALMVDGVPRTIEAKGVNGNFWVEIEEADLPENLTNVAFKVLRQRGISGPLTPQPTFLPDVPGFYTFDLAVNDGTLSSAPPGVRRPTTIINVLESALPRGCTPPTAFIFDYMSNFWDMVEDSEIISQVWGAIAQVAATELFTLWQLEYGKSLRDVQRTFIRRWLHYDLLLPEPLPELTSIRAVWSGISSIPIDDAGLAGVSGSRLVLSTPTTEDLVDMTFDSSDPYTPSSVAVELLAKLKAVDARFSVQTLPKAGAQTVVRIDAPFPFYIDPSTTTILYTDNDVNAEISGTNGDKVVGAERTYKIDKSLEGLDIKENDLLIIDSVAYRIASITGDSGDDFDMQRVVVKEDIPDLVGEDWIISGYVTSELLDFWQGLVSPHDVLYFEVVNTNAELATTSRRNELIQTSVLGVNESMPSSAALYIPPIGAELGDPELAVRLAKVVRRKYLPIDPLVTDIPLLQEFIVVTDEEAVLRRNVDFFIEEFRGRPCIRFVVTNPSGPDVWEDQVPPSRLWAEYTYLDNRPFIEGLFGIPANLTLDQLEDLPEGIDYLSAVRGLWYAYFNGPTLYNLRIGAQIFLGLPFAEQAGTIEEIRRDFSSATARILVRDTANEEIVRSYVFPRELEMEENTETGEPYAVGDSVVQLAPLVHGVDVLDWKKDPTWFSELLGQGIFYEVQKYHSFSIEVDGDVFDLSALLVIRDFILTLKPNYTRPFFIVQRTVEDTAVDTGDVLEYSGVLHLYDSNCAFRLGAGHWWDEPRAAGGGIRNAYDSDDNPATTPTPDTSEPVYWAYDKDYLCPEDVLDLLRCKTKGSGVQAFDATSTPIVSKYFFTDTGGSFAVPLAGLALTPFGNVDGDKNGTLTEVRLLIAGGPGSDPDDYKLTISVNGVPQTSITFTSHAVNTEVIATVSYSINLSDPITAEIAPDSGAVTRNPAWTDIILQITGSHGMVASDTTSDPGNYCVESSL